jgi:hypothetical protein
MLIVTKKKKKIQAWLILSRRKLADRTEVAKLRFTDSGADPRSVRAGIKG